MTVVTTNNKRYTTVFNSELEREVIVIDDSPPLPSLTQAPDTPPTSTRSINDPFLLPPAASTRSKRTLLCVTPVRKQHTHRLPYSPVTTPTTKKRKRNIVIQGPNVRSKVDDKNGHFNFKPNGDLTRRFKMMRILGQGTFGRVIECYDRLRRDRCAIKVIRSIKKYRDASTIEIRILKTLHDHDRDNIYQCIELYEWFEYENHICMVFALMGPSLFDYLKSNRFKPFSLGQIQDFAIQLFTSVEFLHRLKLIHTDLKPENILLVNQPEKTNSSSKVLKNTDIRLIDFGSATFENEYHAEVVSTRHYRAPEIILDIGWSFPCDIWSIGCMLVEFLTGEPLFQTHDDLEHLAMMEAVLGKIPFTMIYQSLPNGLVFFDRRNQLRYPSPSTSVKNLKYVQSLGTLPYIIPTSLSKGHTLLLDLLEKILVLDPKSRLTATEALQHPFMKYTL